MRVLVVDDEEDIGKVFKMGFRDQGVDVTCFANPCEALAWARDVKPDLAVIDVMMPEMNGVELCLALRQLDHSHELPVILISAIDKTELREMAKRVGATCFSKPFAPREVFEHMRTQLTNNH